ncbi:hypothetical protein D3C72_2411910 [compost metagenome]
MREEIKKRYGRDAKLELVSGSRDFFGRKLPGVGASGAGMEQMAAAAVSGLADTLEEKALWNRYGL